MPSVSTLDNFRLVRRVPHTNLLENKCGKIVQSNNFIKVQSWTFLNDRKNYNENKNSKYVLKILKIQQFRRCLSLQFFVYSLVDIYYSLQNI